MECGQLVGDSFPVPGMEPWMEYLVFDMPFSSGEVAPAAASSHRLRHLVPCLSLHLSADQAQALMGSMEFTREATELGYLCPATAISRDKVMLLQCSIRWRWRWLAMAYSSMT